MKDFFKGRGLGASAASLSNSRLRKTFKELYDVGWGLPQQVLATVGCVRRFKELYKERTLKSSTKTQRDPEIQGE